MTDSCLANQTRPPARRRLFRPVIFAQGADVNDGILPLRPLVIKHRTIKYKYQEKWSTKGNLEEDQATAFNLIYK